MVCIWLMLNIPMLIIQEINAIQTRKNKVTWIAFRTFKMKQLLFNIKWNILNYSILAYTHTCTKYTYNMSQVIKLMLYSWITKSTQISFRLLHVRKSFTIFCTICCYKKEVVTLMWVYIYPCMVVALTTMRRCLCVHVYTMARTQGTFT